MADTPIKNEFDRLVGNKLVFKKPTPEEVAAAEQKTRRDHIRKIIVENKMASENLLVTTLYFKPALEEFKNLLAPAEDRYQRPLLSLDSCVVGLGDSSLSDHGEKVKKALTEDIKKIKENFYIDFIRGLDAHVKEAGLPKAEEKELMIMIRRRFGGPK